MEEGIITEEELIAELHGEFLDLFMALLHSILYRSSHVIRSTFFFANMFGTKVPICQYPKVAEYIEMCSKKIVALLSTDSLEGFGVNLVTRRRIFQRFVLFVEGCFDFGATDRNTLQRSLKVLAEQGRHILEQLSENEDVRSLRQNLSDSSARRLRFRIVLGLKEEGLHMYSFDVHGLFGGDPDLDVFPWSKPRKPALSIKPHFPSIGATSAENETEEPLVHIGKPATKENLSSPPPTSKPQHSEHSSPPLAPDSKSNRIEILPEVQVIGGLLPESPTSSFQISKKIKTFPIATASFGESLKFNFYCLAYVKRVAPSQMSPKFGFSVSRIDSPAGLFRRRDKHKNHSHSPLILNRRPQHPSPIIQQEGRESSPVDSSGSISRKTVPVAESSPVTPQQRTQWNSSPNAINTDLSNSLKFTEDLTDKPKSARSLNAAFENSAGSSRPLLHDRISKIKRLF